ncbi:MAG: zinc/manganese transport system permease protein [Hyphomonadaceae bacterium]|nr:MAG: zinc/manganese transport system permease protein [Hyphomonadaceae bacterium]
MIDAIFDAQTGRALVSGLFLAIATAPIGVFLLVRRLALVGDALGHAVLPGATLGALLSGGASWGISFGAAITGSALFGFAASVQKRMKLQEDAVFALFYLGSLSLGLIIADIGGAQVDLEDIWIISLGGMAYIYKPLLLSSIDKNFLENSPKIKNANGIFYVLLALVSVAAFQSLGTLLSVGIFIGPAICAKYWGGEIKRQMLTSVFFSIGAMILGLVFGRILEINPAPLVVLVLVICAIASAFIRREF